LILPEELTFMFMTNLAKEISYDREASIITDNIRFDNYTNISRTIDRQSERVGKFAKGIINLLVPSNLGEMSLKTLIEFRNKNREGISAFNKELENVQDSIGAGITRRKFIDNFNNIYSDFSKEVIIQGIGVAAIPFAAYILINNPQALAPEYAKEVLGGLGLMLGGTYSLSKLWVDKKKQKVLQKVYVKP
jgi:hypothetical protein